MRVSSDLRGGVGSSCSRILRDLVSGRQRQGSTVRGFPFPSPLLQNVNGIDLCRLPPPWLSNPLIYLSHPFNHLIGPRGTGWRSPPGPGYVGDPGWSWGGGPTLSRANRLKGVSIIGMGIRRFLTEVLGATLWHSGHP